NTFSELIYKVCGFYYFPTNGKFNTIVKVENGNLDIKKTGVHLKGRSKRLNTSAPYAVCDGHKKYDNLLKNNDWPSWEHIDDSHGDSQNIPIFTGTSKTVIKAFPKLNGKFTATSLLCCHYRHESHGSRPAKYDDIKKIVKQASEGSPKEILSYTENLVVSYNFNSDTLLFYLQYWG
ncbi:Glyceraldehyde-3-phosphate dehydrogenase, partial [Galemys pyrenaicus]